MTTSAMWSPAGDCHLGLTSGHTMIVPGARDGIDVPPRFRYAARMRGCLPVGIEPPPSAAQERLVLMRAAAKRAAEGGTELSELAAPPEVYGTDPDVPEPAGATAVPGGPVRRDEGGAGLVKRVIAALTDSGAAGATASRIRELVGGAADAESVRVALDELWLSGAVAREKVGARGRPREIWRLAADVEQPGGDARQPAS